MKLYISIIVAVILSGFVLRFLFVDNFIVRGNSMSPLIQDGDYIFVDRFTYLNTEPKRGDIIVSRLKNNEINTRFIKRVIGLPNEIIVIDGGYIVVKTSREDSGIILNEPYINASTTPQIGIQNIKLDPYEYFVLGDNRYSSIDSRELGPLHYKDIIGKIFLRFRLKNFNFYFF